MDLPGVGLIGLPGLPDNPLDEGSEKMADILEQIGHILDKLGDICLIGLFVLVIAFIIWLILRFAGDGGGRGG